VNPRSGPDLDPADCRLICQSVLRNTNLRVLELRAKEARGDTLDDVVAHPSLRRLLVSADEWSDECVGSVARQLRTNTTLESLHAVKRNDDPAPCFRPIAHVLETYNVTLRKVTLRWGFPIPIRAEHALEAGVLAQLRRRNRRIRRAVEQLEPRSYHVAPASLWPHALGLVSPIPTLVYRFLRIGNVNTLCGLLQPGSAAFGTKRGRRASSSQT
jgi:hypothetical protein